MNCEIAGCKVRRRKKDLYMVHGYWLCPKHYEIFNKARKDYRWWNDLKRALKNMGVSPDSL